jgi:hypothetical protein
MALERAVSSSTASSSASGGHAATATANTLNSGAAAMLAHNERQIPTTNANQAAHRPPARRPWPVFHNSTVAVVKSPSTMSGQMAAVVWSAPNRNANSRPCR